MLQRDALRAMIEQLPLVRNVEALARGHLRIETSFRYPDGAFVDLFLVDEGPLLPPRTLSDLGQTMDFLLHHDVKPWSTRKRAIQLAEAVGLHGVRLDGGALVRDVALDAAEMQAGIVELSQACLRMSDLIFTKRLQLQSTFAEDVEELLVDDGLTYQSGARVDGKFGPVPVDFLVRGQSIESAVLTLSARVAPSSHTQAVEVFTRLHDLVAGGAPQQRVTIIDDRVDVQRLYREEDLRRIIGVSELVGISDRQQLHDLLAA